MKQCLKCQLVKPLNDFYNHKGSKDGKTPRCKECTYTRRAPDRRYGDGDCVVCGKPVPIPLRGPVPRRCPECTARTCKKCFGPVEKGQQVCASCRSLRGLWSRFRGHGLTKGMVADLFAEQDGLCAACLKPITLGSCAVDHDHNHCPGEKGCRECVRGLIHRNCNTGIAFFGDDPQKLRSAADYLERGTFLNRNPDIGTPFSEYDSWDLPA